MASDHRDKIYAILGLALDGADIIPTPNYRQPLVKVYFDVFMGMLSRENQCAYGSQEAATVASSDLLTLVPEWTDITRGLPFFLGKLLANSSENTRILETVGYVDAMPKPDNEYCFQEDRDLTLPISFSGFQTPVLYIDTLTDVTTRFKTISTPQL